MIAVAAWAWPVGIVIVSPFVAVFVGQVLAAGAEREASDLHEGAAMRDQQRNEEAQ